jgi:predicted HAD superfamily Cof-like phosphohydrolase
MTNPFKDSREFMNAIDQTTNSFNRNQLKLYVSLIDEEWNELHDALEAQDEPDRVETLDALIDILVVTIGAINSMGADAEGAWNEVMRTNFAKVDPDTGKVRRRDDGKVLKPDNWQPPNLKPFVGE